MKTPWKEVCVALLMGAVLPGLILNFSVLLLEGNARELPIVESIPETYAAEKVNQTVAVLFSDGSIEQMDIDAYLPHPASTAADKTPAAINILILFRLIFLSSSNLVSDVFKFFISK